MKLSARGVTIVVSLAVHGAVGAMALSVAHEKKERRATTVALADQAKKEKKPEPLKPPPPAPLPPKPKAAPPKPAPVAAPTPVAAPEPVAPAAAAPVATDVVMGNDTGMDMGTGQKSVDETKGPAKLTPADKPKPAAAPVKTPIKIDTPPPVTNAEGQCSEPPGKPEPSFKTDIEYTEEARAAGVEGRLVLKVTVDADGNVTAVSVVNGVDPALDAAAIQTVKTWRFKPAMACGKPVAGGTYTIARRFVLGD